MSDVYDAPVAFVTSPPKRERNCDNNVCLYVCLSVCLYLYVRSHVSKTTRPNFTNFFSVRMSMAMARSSAGGVAICHVLPVL